MRARVAFPSSAPVRAAPAESLARGVALSTLYGMAISPVDVARLLERAKVRYVLVGAHSMNLYTGKPRATQDVDVVTDAPAKARRAVHTAYPRLTVEDHPAVIRFRDAGQEVLDLIKARSGRIFRRVLGLATEVRINDQIVVVPTAEAALALKFASMISPARLTDDRMQDAVDFSRASKLQDALDEALLHELGDLVYPGGGDELLKCIADSRAGRRLEL